MRNTILTVLICTAFQLSGAEAAQPARIGVTAAVRGTVKASASAARPSAKTLAGGEEVYLNDKISTGSDGQAQILLLDETVFTIGPNSTVLLDKFVYDPASGAGEVSADILKGCFRFVTGKIAGKNPAKVKVKVVAGTIGVFGTIVSGQVEKDKSIVVLEGPGSLNNSGEKAGRIVVTGTAGRSVTLSRPGYALTAGAGGISGAYEAPPDLLDKLGADLTPTARMLKNIKETSFPSYAAAENLSGEHIAAGKDVLRSLESIAGLSAELEAVGTAISQNMSGFTDPQWDDVRKIAGSGTLASGPGAGFFAPGSVCAGGALNCMGTWDYTLNVNFDARTILASANIATANIADSIVNVPVNYTALTGDSVFTLPTGVAGGVYTWTFSNMGWNNYDISVEGSCTFSDGTNSGVCLPAYANR